MLEMINFLIHICPIIVLQQECFYAFPCWQVAAFQLGCHLFL